MFNGDGPRVATYVTGAACLVGMAAVVARSGWIPGTPIEGDVPESLFGACALAAAGVCLVIADGRTQESGKPQPPHIRRWTALAAVALLATGPLLWAGHLFGDLGRYSSSAGLREASAIALVLVLPVAWVAWDISRRRGLTGGQEVQLPAFLKFEGVDRPSRSAETATELEQRLRGYRTMVRMIAVGCFVLGGYATTSYLYEAAPEADPISQALSLGGIVALGLAGSLLIASVTRRPTVLGRDVGARVLLAIAAPVVLILPMIIRAALVMLSSARIDFPVSDPVLAVSSIGAIPALAASACAFRIARAQAQGQVTRLSPAGGAPTA